MIVLGGLVGGLTIGFGLVFLTATKPGIDSSIPAATRRERPSAPAPSSASAAFWNRSPAAAGPPADNVSFPQLFALTEPVGGDFVAERRTMEFLLAIAVLAAVIWGTVLVLRGSLIGGCLVFLFALCCLGHDFLAFSVGPLPLTIDRLASPGHHRGVPRPAPAREGRSQADDAARRAADRVPGVAHRQHAAFRLAGRRAAA